MMKKLRFTNVTIVVVLSFLFSSLQLSAQRTPLQAEVKMHLGKPVIFLNGKAEYPMVYSLTDVPGGRWAWEELPRYNLKAFCNIGVKLIQVDVAFDHVWREDGMIVLDTVERQLKSVLEVCPDAAIFIRFHVNAPKWWQKKYKEENTIYADTKAKPDINWGLQRIIEDDEETPERTSLASEKWKAEATEKLIKLLQKLQSLPSANALAGIQVAGGIYGEWHYWGFLDNEPDMSEPMKVYFRNWLKQKYKTDKALQAAWHQDNVTFATAPLPTLQQRKETKAGIFRDPLTERNLIDYYEAQHQVVADDILHFCKVIKETWPRPIITGAFYGYFYAVFGRETSGGHLQLQRVLKSPYIDYLSGPGAYYPDARETGDPYRSRSLINSITLNKKLWLDEMDQQPPLLPIKDTAFNTSLAKSIANTRRNIMFTASKGQGMWFYDFGPSGFNGGPRQNDHGSWGWWDEPSLHKDIKEIKTLLENNINTPYTSDADVLLVHDTESFYAIGSDKKYSGVAHWGNNWLPVSVFRSGVVHDAVHLADLNKVNLTQYKAIVFVNTFLLTAEQKKFLQQNIAKQRRHLVWIYAPGYSDNTKLDVANISKVTGIDMQVIEQSTATSITVDPSVVDNYTFSVWNTPINPLFVPNDKQAIVYGKLTGTQHNAFVKKTLKESTSWFIALPPANANLWQFIWEDAGAHIYNKSGDIFYQGSGILTIHTKTGGQRNIKLKNGKELDLKLPENSTTLMNSVTGEILMGD